MTRGPLIFFSQPWVCLPSIFFPRDLFPTEPSIYNVDSGPSVWSPGNSVEIPAVLTSHGALDPDGFLPSTNPPPLKLEEINAECQDDRARELIDRLDAVCHSAIASPLQTKFSFRRWTTRHRIKSDTNCSTPCARCVVVGGCYPSQCV